MPCSSIFSETHPELWADVHVLCSIKVSLREKLITKMSKFLYAKNPQVWVAVHSENKLECTKIANYW